MAVLRVNICAGTMWNECNSCEQRAIRTEMVNGSATSFVDEDDDDAFLKAADQNDIMQYTGKRIVCFTEQQGAQQFSCPSNKE